MLGAIPYAQELAYYSALPNVCARPSRVDKHMMVVMSSAGSNWVPLASQIVDLCSLLSGRTFLDPGHDFTQAGGFMACSGQYQSPIATLSTSDETHGA
jgi:hypothetical protein